MENVTDLIKQPQPQPQVNADLIRLFQHLLGLANAGQIMGFAGTALGTDGTTTHNVHCVPQMPAMIQCVLGAMDVLHAQLVDIVRQAQVQAQTSRIIKPVGVRPPTG